MTSDSAAYTKEQVIAGQATYTREHLLWYDFIVLRWRNFAIWRCPSRKQLALYNKHVSNNHLDIGVGTGFYLDKCRFPSKEPRLGLLDLNANSLASTAERVARYKPICYQQSVLEPFDLQAEKQFDSVGLNYLFHCLPGTMKTKSAVFENVNSVLSPDGVVFGATLLYSGVKLNKAAKKQMDIFNENGIFSNANDDVKTLQENLEKHYTESGVKVQGCGALFWGRKKR